MTLVVDNRSAVQGPGFHVFVVGVSEYANLPSVDDPEAESTWRLKSLGSSALSAALVTDWFRSTTNLVLPLKTLRLLISSTSSETVKLPDWAKAAAIPTRDEFDREATAWRRDCEDSRESVAAFYYAGHGFCRGRGDRNLLLTMADLFDTADLPFKRTVRALNLVDGMGPQRVNDRVAWNQIHIFDCCRSYPVQMKDFDDREVSPTLPSKSVQNAADDRRFVRYWSTPDAASAFASIGKPSYFSEHLVDALSHAGRNTTNDGWVLDGAAISARLNARYTPQTRLPIEHSISGFGPVLRRLGSTPLVDVTVFLDPASRAAMRDVSLQSFSGTLVAATPTAKPGEHAANVDAGFYALQIRKRGGAWQSVGANHIAPDFQSPWITRNWP